MLQELINEFDLDPQGIGYRDASGSIKPVNELIKLLTTRRMIPNPDPPRRVPAKVNPFEVMSVVPPEAIAAADYEALIAFRGAIQADDREALQLQLQVWLIKGWITADVGTRLSEILSRTEPDKNWPKMVPGKSRLEEVFGVKTISKRLVEQAFNELLIRGS